MDQKCYISKVSTFDRRLPYPNIFRFLNLRILIHRRFASLWRPQHQCGDSEQMCVTPLDNALHSTSVDLCQSAAIKLIRAIDDNFVNGFPGAWWAEMNCKYLFDTVFHRSEMCMVLGTAQRLKHVHPLPRLGSQFDAGLIMSSLDRLVHRRKCIAGD
jgi:hypothetical protein